MNRLPRRPHVRWLLAVVLAAFGAPRPARADFESAKQLFAAQTKGVQWKERRNAYGALADHDGGPAAALILQAASAESHPAVLEAAATTLGRMHSEGARAAAIASLRKGKSTERLVAASALVTITGADADAVLVETLASGPAPLAVLAATGLGQNGRAGASAALLAALSSTSPQVRGAAARSLGILGEKAAIAPLSARLKVEKGRARAEVIASLESITHKNLGDSVGKWAAVAAGGDPATVNEQPVLPPTLLGAPVVGERVVFVLDRSLHMRDPHPWAEAEQRERLEALCTPKDGARIPWRQLKTKLQLVAAHLRHAVEGLPSGSKYEVVYFAEDVKSIFGLKWTSPGAATRKMLDEALTALEVDDGINLYDALNTALDLAGAADDKAMKAGPDQIVLLTNNIPTKGDVTDADVIARAIAFRARPRGVGITVVGIGEHPYGLAEELAKRTGGTYVNLSK